MKAALTLIAYLLLFVVETSTVSAGEDSTQRSTLDDDDTIRVPAFELPASSFLTPDARSAQYEWKNFIDKTVSTCAVDKENPFEEERVPALRKCFAENFYPSLIARHRSLYSVRIHPETIGGVGTEIITPAEGVSARNQARILINLHGGGFTVGARYGGQVESIPIAALGKIKVVSVDYRMAPEYKFPAASEDVATVYRDLLKVYRPENVGIFGCSAGGVLAAQAVAWLQKEGLPPPGAVGLFCGAGSYWSEGDSGRFAAALEGVAPDTSEKHPYFIDTDPADPMVFPVRSSQVMAKFPSTLLIAATRDLALSSVVHMHSRLIALGIEADLHVWEGVGHAFFVNPDLPQSREMYEVTVKFFDRHLGMRRSITDNAR